MSELLAAAALLLAGGVLLARGYAAAGSALLALVLGVLLAAEVDYAGQPRPLWLEAPACKAAETVRVRFGQSFEPTEIRILADTPCGQRWWSLPYSQQAAQELQDAQRAAKGQPGHAGRPVTMRLRSLQRPGKPGERGMEDRDAPQFYAEPQPSLPEKTEG